MLRIVVDTNLLVGSAYAPSSASRRIVDACLNGELEAVVSPALLREYEHILPRAVRIEGFDETLRAFLNRAAWVEPSATPRIVPDDPDDDKLMAIALAGFADVVVSNDRHLLELDPCGEIRIMRPGPFLDFAGLRR